MNIAPPPANVTADLRRLKKRIKAVRIKRVIVRSMTGLTLVASVLVGGFTSEAILDRLVNLPWIARALVFVACFGGAGWLLWKETIKPLRKRLNDDAVALLIEHALPVFRTRFIASIQLSRNMVTRTSALVRALVVQTSVMAAALTFRYVVKTARLLRLMKKCAGIVAVAGALLYFSGGAGVLLLKRALLFNVALPGWTYLLNVTGSKNIGVGEDFKIDVTAGGILPSRGRVIATTANGQKREFALTPDPKQPERFNSVIRSPQESFSYIVKLGDATSLTYEVKLFRRPTIADVLCEQIYPAYTGVAPAQRKVTDLSLLVGSRLMVTVKASMKIGKGALRLVGLDRDVPIKPDPKDPTVLHGTIDIPQKDLTGFSVRLVSTDGIDSGDGVVYRIDLVPDHEPSVKIIVPARREELATPLAVCLIAFEAKDDFGVAKATLHYTIDQGPEKTIEFDLGRRTDRTVTRRFEWKLTTLRPQLGVGSSIEYWIAIADNNTATGPGLAETEHYQTKLVTDDEKRQDLANRLREAMSGVTEITESQQELTKSLGEPLFEKQKPTP